MMGIFCQNVTSLFIFTFLKPHSDAFMTLFQIHFLKINVLIDIHCIYANLNELITKLLRFWFLAAGFNIVHNWSRVKHV